MSWRDKFEQIQWDHFYILDADEIGVTKAKEEVRVKPAGNEFRAYMFHFCLEVEREVRESHK